MKGKISDILTLSALILVGIMLITCQEAVSEAVVESLKTCAYTIIPSLFAMTVLSTAVSQSGIVRSLFSNSNISADIFTAFILGNIGGYPIGAKLLAISVEDGRISKEEAAKSLGFCFGSGPAFAAGIAGTAIFGDIRFGIAALIANIAANATLYIRYLIFNKPCKGNHSVTDKIGFSSSLMVESVSSATSAMITISSMIVFFSAIRALLECAVPQISSAKYLPAILEISNISHLNSCKGISLATVSMLLSFGGLCVNMQIIAMAGGKFSMKNFYLSRIAAVLLSGLYGFLLEKLLYAFGIVREASTKIRLSQSPSLIPIICVAAMVFITITYQSKRRF